MKRLIYLLILIIFNGCLSPILAQENSTSSLNDSLIVFRSVEQLIQYSQVNSIMLANNEIQLSQAKKGKLAAVLGTIDVTGNLLSAQFTDNTQLGVSLFPAEVLGGTPGTFQEVQMGVRYNTNVTNYVDVKLINPVGWTNLKLTNLSIDLTSSNNRIGLKNFQENIANNYFNILNLIGQIKSTKQNLGSLDTLLIITKNKYETGVAKQQDVNEAKANYLKTKETISQMEYLLKQYYLSLKILADIPKETSIKIVEQEQSIKESNVNVLTNQLSLKNALLQEQYKKANYLSAKASFSPTVSLQLSNSNNLYNSAFDPLQGNWINSNYIGLRVAIPIPNSQVISKKTIAKHEYQISQNNVQKARTEAFLNKEIIQNDYYKAISQLQSDKEILKLREENFTKNLNLYNEGLVGLEITINSYNELRNAQFNKNSSEVNLHLILTKISINNNIK